MDITTEVRLIDIRNTYCMNCKKSCMAKGGLIKKALSKRGGYRYFRIGKCEYCQKNISKMLKLKDYKFLVELIRKAKKNALTRSNNA